MEGRPGIDYAYEQMTKAGMDVDDNHQLVYQATLATLVRRKLKERVPPSFTEMKIFDMNKHVEDRFPKYSSKLSPADPPEYPYDCDPECETCFTQTFPARVSVPDKAAGARIKQLTAAINEDLRALRLHLRNDADRIVAKWKKSKAKRADILAQFCPDPNLSPPRRDDSNAVSLYDKKWGLVHLINEHYRGDVDDLAQRAMPDPLTLSILQEASGLPNLDRFFWHQQNLKEREHLSKLKDRYRTTWLLPYLDAQTLAEDPLQLLSLLHVRTSHSPEEWMMFDNSQLKAAEQFETLVSEFNANFVVMTGKDYGMKLVKWNAERCHRWQIVGYLKATHILTAQRQLMRFLRCTVEALLEVGPPQSQQHPSQDPKWNSLVDNGFVSLGGASNVSIRTPMNPFAAPPTFNPVKTYELVRSMYEASVDELELAQTNPAYVQCLLRNLDKGEYAKAHTSEGRLGFLIDELFCNFYRRFIWWRQMEKECRIMLDRFRDYEAHPHAITRRAYEQAIYVVHDIAIEHLANQILLVQYSMPFQSGFVRNFEYERTSDKAMPMIISDTDAFQTDVLFWSIRGMGFDRDRIFTLDPSYHFRVLDHHMSQASLKERKRINDQLTRSLSEMAVVEDIRTTIECDRGWSRELSESDVAHPQFRTDFIKFYVKQLEIPRLVKRSGVIPELRKFMKDNQWPSGKMDENWLKAAAASRETLSKFWARFRAGLKSQQISKGLMQEFIDDDEKALSAALSASNIHAVEEEERAIRDKIKPKSRPPPTALPATWPTDGLEKLTIMTPQPKPKKKTRPSPSTATESEDSSALPSSAPTSPPSASKPEESAERKLVKHENFNLFQSMFANPKSQSRAYSWVHFTQAMVDAGCSVTQGSGSAVHFRSESGVIVFHRPHPEPTIAQEILMGMGKRLTRRWG